MRNKSDKNVWGLRPYTFFTLLLRHLGPQTPSGHICCAILIYIIMLLIGLLGGADSPNLGTGSNAGSRWPHRRHGWELGLYPVPGGGEANNKFPEWPPTSAELSHSLKVLDRGRNINRSEIVRNRFVPVCGHRPGHFGRGFVRFWSRFGSQIDDFRPHS